MTTNPHDDAPLFRLGRIATEIEALQKLCEETDHPQALAELARLMEKIGRVQLELARAAADAAALSEHEHEFPQIRTTLN